MVIVTKKFASHKYVKCHSISVPVGRYFSSTELNDSVEWTSISIIGLLGAIKGNSNFTQHCFKREMVSNLFPHCSFLPS